MTGTTLVVTCEPFSPKLFFHLVKKYKVSMTSLVPPQLTAIKHFKGELNSLETIIKMTISGDKTPVGTINFIKDLLSPQCEFIEFYGCTEQGRFTANTKQVPGSCGTIIPNVEIQIKDENCISLGPNEDGEIFVRNFLSWKGYLNDEEATKEVYDQKTCWYRTGDLGHFDDEGNLFIVHRIKAMVKIQGYDISPTEIEMQIKKLSQVSDVCVVGFPGNQILNVLGAMVIKTESSRITENDIMEYVSESMPYYKHLTAGVYFVDKIPSTNTGKVARRKVRDIVVELYHERFGNL